MLPGGGGTGGNRDFNYRIPPAWSPENQHTYSFRSYLTDISVWIMLTVLMPRQQRAAIAIRFGGAARDIGRMITPAEILNGGIQNGVQVDIVTFLLGDLHARFSQFEEESRLTCMTEMFAFERRAGEDIHSLLARYDTVRHRAAVEGHIVMSIEGCSPQLLRACNIGSQHLFILLKPFQSQLPQYEAHMFQLCAQLRHFGHISERAPGNIAACFDWPSQASKTGCIPCRWVTKCHREDRRRTDRFLLWQHTGQPTRRVMGQLAARRTHGISNSRPV